MNGSPLGVILVAFGLFIFGVLYNMAVEWARPRGWLEPYTSLWVAFGVLVTIAGAGIVDLLVDWNASIITLVCFIASGTPMILGDFARYVRQVQAERNAIRDETKTLAE